MRAKKVNEAIKHLTPRDKSEPRFDYKTIRKILLSLKKLGYIVQEEDTLATPNRSRHIYWKIGNPEGKNFTGIGYSFPNVSKKEKRYGVEEYEETGDYFYHNSHSGNINHPNTSIGSVWNHHSEKPGPGGWYTFDDNYIFAEISRLVKDAPKRVNEGIKHLPGRPKEDFYFLTNIHQDPEDPETIKFDIDYNKLIPFIKEHVHGISDNEMDRFLAFELDRIIDGISYYRFENNDLDWINNQLKSGIERVGPHWMGMHSDKAMRRIAKNSGMNI